MKQYWPNAIVCNEYEKPFSLHTTDSCLDLQECAKIFKCWQDDYQYKLLSTWIDVVDDDGSRNIINHRCHVNILGQVKKIC